MKPFFVVLIALASAIAGGIVGALIGGAAGGLAGASGAGVIGIRTGVCSAVEAAKAQKLINPTQADQLMTQSYDKIRDLIGNKDFIPADNPDCQATFNTVKQLGGK
ncbi:hypothetical protein K9N68_21810 [Kovacikia minuta CCNUW1]|uniref:hypothetical protein n=1 Tax=Kovacikia minuta TaxID=2931930 RepID=UPI001CCA06E4|nr:hypothetical protein [Kovacikia minuta]UBF24327.1 hypothetical protein K9N68_21810 [Kovacikia minuta CCNUW1]